MNELKNFMNELRKQPVKLVAISVLAVIIVIFAMFVTILSVPSVQTVTSFNDCVNAGGAVSGRTCEIADQQFSGPIRIQVPRFR